MPHGDHDHCGFYLGASVQELQRPGPRRSKELALQMNLVLSLHLLPNLSSKMAEEQSMLNRFILVAEDTEWRSWDMPLLQLMATRQAVVGKTPQGDFHLARSFDTPEGFPSLRI
jgi:hypothetical protein